MSPDVFAAQSFMAAGAPTAPTSGGVQAATRAAREFEAFFLARSFESMQTDLDADSSFSGGPGERAWRGPLADAYAKAIVQSGGVGLTDRLRAELLALQSQETV